VGIQQRTASDPGAVRKHDRVPSWIQNKASDKIRTRKDTDELEEIRRKVQNLVDEFTVRSSLKVDGVGAEELFIR
jgi:hypothetical protein